MTELADLLQLVAARHHHLCPRQVLGARTALAGAAALGFAVPRADRRLLVFVESDGCFADGVEVATGATIGRRTLRVMDFGKAAATLVDARSEAAVRVAPRPDIRARALAFVPEEPRRYYAQLLGYQRMPDEELLVVTPVSLTMTVRRILSRASRRVACDRCGEEIHNEREVLVDGLLLCAACAGQGYYREETT